MCQERWNPLYFPIIFKLIVILLSLQLGPGVHSLWRAFKPLLALRWFFKHSHMAPMLGVSSPQHSTPLLCSSTWLFRATRDNIFSVARVFFRRGSGILDVYHSFTQLPYPVPRFWSDISVYTQFLCIAQSYSIIPVLGTPANN